jgi:hypothetical protein
VTEAVTPTGRAALYHPALSGGVAAGVVGLGSEVEAGAEAVADLVVGDHVAALPAVLGVERHLLDEAQLVVVVDGPFQHVARHR